MDTATVLGEAMTEYVLLSGVVGRAPAAGAPEYIALWLEANGYQIVPASGHRSRRRRISGPQRAALPRDGRRAPRRPA
jgi:hypothetical protein